jgi:gliding motility-associated-like protein
MANGTFEDCDGFFLDSGGNGNYGANEDLTTTICPDPGAVGTHVQLVFAGPELQAGDVICFFDGPDATAPMLACNTDFSPNAPFIIQTSAANPGGCMTVTFNSDGTNEAQGWEADINCVAECQIIQSVISMADPAIMPADTGYIDICPGERIFLDGMGIYPQNGLVYEHSDLTSTFEWDFGDGISGVGPSVAHTYEEPGGYIVQLKITDIEECESTNFISQRIRVSPVPTFDEGTPLPAQICTGDTIELNSNVSLADSIFNVNVTAGTGGFQTEQTRADSIALPDGGGASYTSSVSFTDFSPGQVLTNVDDILRVCIDIEHSYMRDIEMILVCPDGTEVQLLQQVTSGGQVFLGEPFEDDEIGDPIPGIGYEYCYTANAPNPDWLTYANANNPATLPAGDYMPFESFDAFLGCPLNGEWTIIVRDWWGIDNGFLFSWSIEFAQDLYPSIETFSPTFTDWGWQDNPSIFFNTPDSIAATPNAGTAAYTFETMNSFGCAFDTTFSLTVLPPTHPDCYDCGEQLVPAEDETICAGEQVAFDVGGVGNSEEEVIFETVPNYPLGKPNHPPANAYLSEIAVNSVNPSTLDDPLTNILSVCVDFETNWNSDIQISLVSPNGTELELSTNNGGSGDNYTNTCFTPTAVNPITGGTSPFTGEFQPEGNWTELTGDDANGTWALKISDANGPQMGLLRSWSITFQAENDVVYTWLPMTDLSCGLCPDPVATPNETRTYTITAIDSYGCDANDEVTVEVIDEIAAPMVNCTTDLDAGEINLDWNAVNGILDYEINLGAGWIPISGTEYTISGLAQNETVDYEIRAISANGNCGVITASESCTLVFTCQLTVESGDQMTQGQVDCDGSCDYFISVSTFGAANGDIIYSAVNNDTGMTVPHPNTSSGAFPGLCPGSYTFTAEDTDGCTDSFDYLITAPPVVELEEAAVEDVSCFGGNDGSATVSASGGNGTFDYQWNDAQMQTGATATFLIAGTYIVTATDALGCTETIAITIGEPTALTADVTVTDVLCFGSNSGDISITPAGGTPPYSIAWQDVPDGQELFAGNYTATVTDLNNCEFIVNETVNEPADAIMAETMQTFVSCFGTNESSAIATATGGTGIYSFAWDTGANTAEATNLTPTTHEVTVSDENGCSDVQFITVQQHDELVPNVVAGATSCSGTNDGNATVNFVTGGVGTPDSDLSLISYSWSSGATSQVAEDLASGPISVTVTDLQGCVGEASSNVTSSETIQVETDFTVPLCAGDATGTASVVNVINGSGNVTFLWDAAANNQTTATATDLAAGTYSVTATDGSDCISEATITIEDPTAVVVDFETVDNECFGDFEGVATATATGGTGNLTYLWETGDSSPEITNLQVGTYEITVVDENDCRLIDSVTIFQPGPIEAEIEVDNVDCFGGRNGSITLTPIGGTAPFLYSTDGVSFNGSSTQIGLVAGEYTAYIQDANGCTNPFEAEVLEPAAIDLFAVNGSDTLRNGDEIVINLGDSTVINGEAFNLQGANEFIWTEPYLGTLKWFTEADSSQVETITQNTVHYDLFVIDENGCTDEIQIQVRVIKDRVVLVPTGFSPNDTGNPDNEALHVHGKEGTIIDVFRVYDRWGEVVYEVQNFPVNDMSTGWDGNFRGKEMPSGVYVWYLEARYIDGNTETFKGNTTLLR